MNTKHTPGPWRWDSYGALIGPNMEDVLYAQEMQNTAGLVVDNEANARLIAAAPELLESLEAVIGILDALWFPGREPNYVDSHPAAKAREVIAKARGEV